MRLLAMLVSIAAVVPVQTARAGPTSATSTVAMTGPQPPPWKPFNLFSLIGRDELIAELERRHLQSGSFAELLELVTRGLVAAPYLLSPLGEGRGQDLDPKFRLDAFDCTTFVETAMALAACDDLEEAKHELDRIRYKRDAQVFEERRHLMVAQWIPGLIEAGLLEEITEQIGGEKTIHMEFKMSRRRWKRRRVAKELDLPKDELPVGTFVLPYLTIKDAKALVKKVPPGVIVNVVRENHPAYPNVITHQGLIVNRPGSKIPLVRHASPVSKRVIDETLDHMLMRYLRPRKWKIIGVNYLRVVDPRQP